MAFDFSNSNMAVRETRLNSITGFSGNLETLAWQSKNCSLKNCERCFMQSNHCASAQVVEQLTCIIDAAVIYHTPAGCAAMAFRDTSYQVDCAVRVGRQNHSIVVCTDLNENDTVFGATEALRKAVRYTWNAMKPSAIFIAASCTAGIIGEDIDSVAEELADEIPVALVPVHCEGFKSRVWATGFDLTAHAVLQGLVKPPKAKRNTINILDFIEGERTYITRLFAELDAVPQFLWLNATVEECAALSEARATTSICDVLSSYLGTALEEKYGVPYIRSLNPHGMAGFDEWLRAIGRVLGQEAKVEEIIARERERYLPQILELKKQLSGLRAVVGAGSGYTYEIVRVLDELGIEVVDAIAWHHDPKYDDGGYPRTSQHLLDAGKKDLHVLVTDLQDAEITNVINREKPDVYICRHGGTTISVIKLGIPVVNILDEFSMFGYHRTLTFAKLIRDSVANQSLTRNVAAHSHSPYTAWWLSQNETKFFAKKQSV